MKVNIEELSSVQRKLTVEIDAQRVSQLQENMYKKLKRQAKIKGFRQGKVPRAILERYYGPQVAGETAETVIQETYPQALQEAGLEPLARPDFDFEAPEPGQAWTYHVILDVRPEFELDPAAYKGLELKEPDLEVTDEEVESRLDELRQRQAVLVPLEEDRPAAIGDVVVVNYESFVGDEPVEGGAADNVEVELGGGQVQEEIEVALVKTKPGDMVNAEVDYPEESNNPKLAGKTVTFKLLVKDIKTKVLPELDDDFAQSVGPEFESLSVLKERIAGELENGYQEQKDSALRQQILDAIRELGEFELPGSLVEEEAGEMAERFLQRLKSSGMDLGQAALDSERLKNDFRPQAERKVRAGIVLGRIAELEQVEAEDQDVEAEIARMAERVGQSAAVVKDMYSKNNMMPALQAQVLEEKTLQAIKADAKITAVDPAELAQETAEKEKAQQEADQSGADG